MRGAIIGLAGLSLTIASSITMILLGIVYFMVTIWMIKIGASWAGLKDVSGSMIVLTAGIVTAAVLMGSARK